MNCRVGDLAIVIRSEVPSNLGMFVEVCSQWNEEPGYWWVRSLSGARARLDGRVALEGAVADDALRPIRGRKPGSRGAAACRSYPLFIEDAA